MPLTPEDVKKLMPSLEAFLSMKASEALEGGEEPPEGTADAAAAESPMEGGEKPGGLGVVIAMKPKPAPGGGGKVPGCPDCADGTPHEHVGK